MKQNIQRVFFALCTIGAMFGSAAASKASW